MLTLENNSFDLEKYFFTNLNIRVYNPNINMKTLQKPMLLILKQKNKSKIQNY